MCLLIIYHCEVCHVLFGEKVHQEQPKVVICKDQDECKGNKGVAQGVPGPCGRGMCKKEAEKLRLHHDLKLDGGGDE